MALEIVHTERAYIVVDNEQGRWSSQSLYGSYLNTRKFASAWKAAAKYWRRCWKRTRYYSNLQWKAMKMMESLK